MLALQRDACHILGMPKPKPAKDANARAVAAVNAVTGSPKVRGEDLLPRRLAKQLREAKKRVR